MIKDKGTLKLSEGRTGTWCLTGSLNDKTNFA